MTPIKNVEKEKIQKICFFQLFQTCVNFGLLFEKVFAKLGI